MVTPFLPEVPEKDLREGYTPLTYLLEPRGYKDFQKLVEDTSPLRHCPPRFRLKNPHNFPLFIET